MSTKTVITGLRYDLILKAFTPIQPTMRIYLAPITDPSSFSSRAKSAAFPFFDWKYVRSEFVQCGVEVGSVLGIFVGWWVSAFSPHRSMQIVGVFRPILTLRMTLAMSIGFQCWPRESGSLRHRCSVLSNTQVQVFHIR